MNACRDVAHSLEIHWTAFSYSPDFIEVIIHSFTPSFF